VLNRDQEGKLDRLASHDHLVRARFGVDDLVEQRIRVRRTTSSASSSDSNIR
jgi:hypothetical protein